MTRLFVAFLVAAASVPFAAEARRPAPARVSRPPVLSCTCTYGGESTVLTVEPTAAPYRVEAVPIGARFLFKAVWVTEPAGEARVDLTVYQARKDGPAVPLHESRYRPPYPVPGAGGKGGFTGLQLVYEPDLSAELLFECDWRRDAADPR